MRAFRTHGNSQDAHKDWWACTGKHELCGRIWVMVHALLLLLQCGLHTLRGQLDMRFESLVSLDRSSKTTLLQLVVRSGALPRMRRGL